MLKKFTWPGTDADGICLAQTIGAAGALTINGPLLDLKFTSDSGYNLRRAVMGDGIQRAVTITSTDDQSGVDFTITGYDLYGNVVSEVIAGGDNTTVETTAEFSEVHSITTDGAVGTAVTVGSGAVGSTRWWTPNREANPTTIALYLVLGGTINATVEDTPVDINGTETLPTSGQIFDHPTLAGETSSGSSNYAFAPGAIRATVASGSGTMEFTIVQAGG